MKWFKTKEEKEAIKAEEQLKKQASKDKKLKELAEKWYKEYLTHHNGKDQGVKYCIGYFADEQHRNNLYKWFK